MLFGGLCEVTQQEAIRGSVTLASCTRLASTSFPPWPFTTLYQVVRDIQSSTLPRAAATTAKRAKHSPWSREKPAGHVPAARLRRSAASSYRRRWNELTPASIVTYGSVA